MRRSNRREKPRVGWRTPAGVERYEKALSVKSHKSLLEEPRLKEWKYWALINNKYPYDALFEIHHLLIPIRVTSRKQLSRAERDELEDILEEVKGSYDRQIINFPSLQSIDDHFHIHLVSEFER